MNYNHLNNRKEMKKLLLLLIAISISGFISAQITVTTTDMGVVGDQITMARDSSVLNKTVLPSSSMSQVFDFMTLNVSSIGDVDFLAPSNTPFGASFPNSNIAISRGAEVIYAINGADSIVVDGIYGDLLNTGSSQALNIDPDMLLMPFPLTYNTTYSTSMVVDTVIDDTITGLFDSLRVKSVTTITTLVDAFGTLNLPTLSVDVLRKKDIEVQLDSIWGVTSGVSQLLQQTSTNSYFYRYIGKNHDFYLLELEADQSGVVLTADFQTGGMVISGVVNNDKVKCFGGSDGSIQILGAGGLPPYSYLWSNGETTTVITGLTAGAYSVTTTDANNDTFIRLVTVVQNDSLDIVSSQIGADHGLDDGFIFINVSGGTPSYNYDWSNGETTKNIEDLPFGAYTVTVTDFVGCTNSNTFLVDDVTTVGQITDESIISFYPNPFTEWVNIETNENWEISVWNITGAMVAEMSGNGSQKVNLSMLNPGMYYLKMDVNNEVFTVKIQCIK